MNPEVSSVQGAIPGTAPIISLRAKIWSAASWTMVGFAYSQVLRLLGNMILARLLFPESFGVMALVQSALSGMVLLSDVGITQSIVYNREGEQRDFLNTAWTLQIVRGVVIWLALWACAAPLGRFYGEPALAQVLPVAGFNAVLLGLLSTKAAIADRKLALKRVTAIDLACNTLGLLTSLVWAVWIPSVWALVAGNLTGTLLRVLGTHLLLAGENNALRLHAGAVRMLMGFGRWVFLSSVLTFIAGEGNRLLIGKLLDVRLLAFYSIANTLTLVGPQVIQQIGGRVLFPAYAEVARERRGDLAKLLWNSRLLQLLPMLLIGATLAIFGKWIIRMLYDNRYQDAGWMLQILGLSLLPGSLLVSYGGVLWAIGKARENSILLGLQTAMQLTLMYVGASHGAQGLVMASVWTMWLLYPCYAVLFARHQLWQPLLDLPVLAGAALLTAVVLPGLGP